MLVSELSLCSLSGSPFCKVSAASIKFSRLACERNNGGCNRLDLKKSVGARQTKSKHSIGRGLSSSKPKTYEKNNIDLKCHPNKYKWGNFTRGFLTTFDGIEKEHKLTHLFPMHHFSTTFSEGRRRVHW